MSQHKKLCCAHAEAAHIIFKHLALPTWMEQLSPCRIGCKTQIDLIFWNIFKAASLSCYITVTMKILELIY